MDFLKWAGLSDSQILLLSLTMGTGVKGGIEGAKKVGGFRDLRDAMNREEVAHLMNGDMPPPGAGPISDAWHIYTAKQNLEKMDTLIREAEKSDHLKEAAPDIIAKGINDAGGNKSVYIDQDAIFKLYTDIIPGSEKDPLQIPDKIKESFKTNTDVEMSIGDFVAKMARNPELYQKLREDIRTEPEGVTPRNADKLKPQTEDIFKKLAEEKEPTIEEQAQSTWDRIKKSFYWQPLFKDAKAAGMTEPQFKLHMERFMKIDSEAFTKLAAKMAERKRKELSPEWKAAESEIRPQVEAEMNSASLP